MKWERRLNANVVSVPPPLTHSAAPLLHPNLFTLLFSPLHPTSLSCSPYCSHYISFTHHRSSLHPILLHHFSFRSFCSSPFHPQSNWYCHSVTHSAPQIHTPSLSSIAPQPNPHSLWPFTRHFVCLTHHYCQPLFLLTSLLYYSSYFFTLIIIVCWLHLTPPAHVSSRLSFPSLSSSSRPRVPFIQSPPTLSVSRLLRLVSLLHCVSSSFRFGPFGCNIVPPYPVT